MSSSASRSSTRMGRWLCSVALLTLHLRCSDAAYYSHNCSNDQLNELGKYGFVEQQVFVHGLETGIKSQQQSRSEQGSSGEFTLCGETKETACLNLDITFAYVPTFCVPELSKPHPWGWPRTALKCQDGCITQVVLLARQPSCQVMVGSSHLAIINNRDVVFKFIKDNESDCDYATIVFDPAQPDPYRDNEDNLTQYSELEIRNSSSAAFRQVRFLPGTNYPAVSVIDSLQVTFDDVIFESDGRHHSLVVLSSIDVHLHNVSFRNASSRPGAAGPASATLSQSGRASRRRKSGDGKTQSALYIRYNHSSFLNNTDLWMEMSSFRYICPSVELLLIDQCKEQQRRRYTLGRPSIVLYKVAFEDLVARRPLVQHAQDKQSQSGAYWRQTGVAAEMHFLDRTQTAYVLCKKCSVRRVRLDAGVLHTSPIYVRFSAQASMPAVRSDVRNIYTCEKNSVRFVDCEFSDNAGYLGGVLHVGFAGNRRLTVYNAVAVIDSRLVGNTAVLEGGAVFVHMGGILQASNAVVMKRTHFQGNVAGSRDRPTAGGALLLISESRADKSLNLTSRMEQWFEKPYAPDRRCDPEGRLFRPPEIQDLRYSITVLDCHFERNVGVGAVYSRLAQVSLEGSTSFVGNTGTALVAMNCNITISGNLTVTGNRGRMGGAFHVGEFGSISMTGVDPRFFIIADNSAVDRGGGFYVDGPSSTQSKDQRLLHLGRDRQYLECPLQFPLDLNSSAVATLLTTNKVKALDQSGFFIASWQRCYGILNIIDQPRPQTLSETVDFCAPFDIFSGWPSQCSRATGATLMPTVATLVRRGDVRNGSLLSPLGDPPVDCTDFTKVVQAWLKSVLELDTHQTMKALGVQAPISSPRDSCPSKVISGKPLSETATKQLRARFQRPLSSFLSLSQKTICKCKFSEWVVLNDIDIYKTKFSTEAAWLFFGLATTSCFKTIGNRVWYFRDHCWRDTIFDFATKYNESENSLGLLSSTDASLLSLAVKHYRFRASALPVMPGPRFTLTPWADAMHMSNAEFDMHLTDSDDDEVVGGDACRRNDNDELVKLLLRSKSDLTLHPAPGEVFDLDITVTDELLNRRSATLSVKVESKCKDVLLGHDNHLYSPDEFVLFSTGQNNWALSILGLPGSQGHVLITVESDYNQRPSADEKLVLRIPFLLRNCHLGFDPPIIRDKIHAQEYVKEFTSCRKYEDRATCYRSAGNVDGAGIASSKLTCRCPEHRAGVTGCVKGRQIQIRRDYWAGFWRNKRQREVWQREVISEYNTTEFVNSHQKDPFGKHDNDFRMAPCENGVCSDHKYNRSWILSETSPCNPDMGRVGPLCGMCRENTYVLVSSERCVPCDHKLHGGITIYVLLVVMVTTIVFLVLVFFGVGVTATLDSWLFFMQAVFCLYPDNLVVGAISYNSLTYGFGQLCISESLQRMEAKMLLIIQPGVLFALLGIFRLMLDTWVGIWIMDRLRRGREVGEVLPRVLWLCILYSSSVLAYVALTLLTCVKMDTDLHVLFVDGSVECFCRSHLPYAIVAILILLLFISPPQIILAVAPRWHIRNVFIQHFINRAKSIYRRRCSFWPAISLLRRLMFAFFLTAITDGAARRLSMTILSLTLLAVHAVFRPYKREPSRQMLMFTDIDNTFESIILLDLSVLCVLRTVVSDFGIDDSRRFAQLAFYPLYATPTAMVLCMVACRVLPPVLRSRGMLGGAGHGPTVAGVNEDTETPNAELDRSCSVGDGDGAGDPAVPKFKLQVANRHVEHRSKNIRQPLLLDTCMFTDH